jgi:hypothetical protein
MPAGGLQHPGIEVTEPLLTTRFVCMVSLLYFLSDRERNSAPRKLHRQEKSQLFHLIWLSFTHILTTSFHCALQLSKLMFQLQQMHRFTIVCFIDIKLWWRNCRTGDSCDYINTKWRLKHTDYGSISTGFIISMFTTWQKTTMRQCINKETDQQTHEFWH